MSQEHDEVIRGLNEGSTVIGELPEDSIEIRSEVDVSAIYDQPWMGIKCLGNNIKRAVHKEKGPLTIKHRFLSTGLECEFEIAFRARIGVATITTLVCP